MPSIEEIILSLSKNERRILRIISKLGSEEIYEDEIADKSDMSLAEISRSILWLGNKNIVKRYKETRDILVLTEKGERYTRVNLPEQRVLDALKQVKSIKLDDLTKKLGMDLNEISVAIGVLTRYRCVNFDKKTKVLKIINKCLELKKIPTQKVFDLILSKKWDAVFNMQREVKNLLKRGLLKYQKEVKWKIRLTELGKNIVKTGFDLDIIDKLTPEIISNKLWLSKKIRWYDVESPVPKVWGGRKHPLRIIIERIRQIFLEMGFREMRGPWVETAFWNMDSMWIPQDHPAREMQATFYLSKPRRGIVRDKELLRLVKEVQETGGDTGSIGWQQPWSKDEALKTLLRTHTTAVTFRVLGFIIRNGLVKLPVKFFTIDRVFRNETIDWKHLAEFHQVEGFVIAKNLSLRSLMGYIKEFYTKIGIKKIRFKPTYNPYTEPSMEIFAWHPHVGEWVEVGNSGIFRPETLRPYGIKEPVIAWGLAVERLAMLIYGIEDIRKVFGPMCDINWLRWYKIPLGEAFGD